MEVDGRAREGTGAEDLFLGGFCVMGGRFSTPTHGCVHLNLLTARVSAYRLYEADPIPFDASLEMTLDRA